jgi:hypothetical protein
MRDPLSRRCSLSLALAALLTVVALQAFNSFACYQHGLAGFLGSLGFVAFPLLPAILASFSREPLRAVGGCLLFSPWLIFAYYTDCVSPYTGGGASMIYVAVVLWGLPSTLLGVVLAPSVFRPLGLRTEA